MPPDASTLLLDRSIDDLQQLARALAAELETDRPRPEKSSRYLRRKEALQTISVLLAKLAAVKTAGT